MDSDDIKNNIKMLEYAHNNLTVAICEQKIAMRKIKMLQLQLRGAMEQYKTLDARILKLEEELKSGKYD